MRFKREDWQPTIGDKFDFYVFNKKAVVIDKSKVKIGQVGIQASSKHMIEQYHKAKRERENINMMGLSLERLQ